jgi:hypothetical protein
MAESNPILDIVEEIEVTPAPVETKVDEVAEEKGEEKAAPPAETPEDHKRKGQEAALLAERRRRQELEREMDELRRQAQPPQPKQEPAEGAPDPAKFDDYGEYMRAVSRWEAKQVLDEERRNYAQAQQQRRHQDAQTQFQRATADRVAAGQAKYQDFDSVINDGLAPFLTPHLHAALVDSDMGHDVAYYLGKHPVDAERIANLHPVAAAREIGRLEAKLLHTTGTATSAAPDPITPVGSRAKASKDPGQMTDAEYLAWRKKGRK